MSANQAVVAAVQPRGLNREEAARYVGLGTTKFDELVARRRMPKPRQIDGRVIWDRLELDAYFSELPHRPEAADKPQKNYFDPG